MSGICDDFSKIAAKEHVPSEEKAYIEEYDKCPSCDGIPTPPTVCNVWCKCRQGRKWCLAHLYKRLQLAVPYRFRNKHIVCWKCREECNTDEAEKEIYSVDIEQCKLFDKMFKRPQPCPERCGWMGKWVDAEEHFKVCPKVHKHYCTECIIYPMNADELEKHIQREHRFPCKWCDIPPMTPDKLSIHTRKVHIRCKICRTISANKEEHKAHLISNHIRTIDKSLIWFIHRLTDEEITAIRPCKKNTRQVDYKNDRYYSYYV